MCFYTLNSVNFEILVCFSNFLVSPWDFQKIGIRREVLLGRVHETTTKVRKGSIRRKVYKYLVNVCVIIFKLKDQWRPPGLPRPNLTISSTEFLLSSYYFSPLTLSPPVSFPPSEGYGLKIEKRIGFVEGRGSRPKRKKDEEIGVFSLGKNLRVVTVRRSWYLW